MSTTHIRRAGPADTDEAADLIGQAFHDLAVSAWLVPDPTERAKVLPANFRIMVEHALRHGQVHYVGAEPAAVAVWFYQQVPPPPPPPDYDHRLAAACGPWTDRFRALDEAFEDHHPQHVAHHHLAFLAVRPDLQSHQLGSTLLRHHHRHLDHAGMPAYLEASSPRSRDFYLRHGYQLLDHPFHLPDDGPPLWPMWREALTEC